MSIDWFTVVAQAVNFVILVWLLKRFLYKPILAAIDGREQWIATELADADAKEAQALKERDHFERENAALQQRCAAVLTQATEAASAEGHRLLEEARQVADALRTKRQEALRKESQDLSQALSRRTEQEVFAVARKALADLATTGLEEQIGEVFLRRLRAMDDTARERFGAALRSAKEPALLRSAFDLPPDRRAAVQRALDEAFSAPLRVRFETAPDLIGGIELTAGGQRLGWNLADYLTSLQQGVATLLKEHAEAQAIPGPGGASHEPRAR